MLPHQEMNLKQLSDSAKCLFWCWSQLVINYSSVIQERSSFLEKSRSINFCVSLQWKSISSDVVILAGSRSPSIEQKKLESYASYDILH